MSGHVSHLATVAALLLLLSTAAVIPAAAQEPLTLRVADAAAEPGEMAVVVIRTYAPRPVSQGQLCFRIGTRARIASRVGARATAPLVLTDVRVFSAAEDVNLGFDQLADGTVMVDFSSTTASVNETDGPLAALFFELGSGLQVGDIVDVELDLPNTTLTDGVGNSIAIDTRAGELEILPPGSPLQLEVGNVEVAAGGVALVEISTRRSRKLGGGTVAVDYEPALLAADPRLVVERDHGSFTAGPTSIAGGTIRLDFVSPSGDFNEVPGDLFVLELPISVSVPPGTVSPLDLDAILTELLDPAYVPISLALEGGSFTVLPPGTLFQDGFESGDLSAWQ